MQQVIFNCLTFCLDMCTKGGMQVCFMHALFVWRRETKWALNNLLAKSTAFGRISIQQAKHSAIRHTFTIWLLDMLEIPIPTVYPGFECIFGKSDLELMLSCWCFTNLLLWYVFLLLSYFFCCRSICCSIKDVCGEHVFQDFRNDSRLLHTS